MLAREEASSEGAKNAWMPPEGPRKPVAGFFRPSGILMPPEGKRRSTGLKTAFPCTGKKYPPFGNKKSPLEGPKKLKIGGRAVIVRPQSGLDFYFSGWGGGGNSPPSAGIPRQVWYAVTKAVCKALKRWGAWWPCWLAACVVPACAGQYKSGSIRLLCHCGSIA